MKIKTKKPVVYSNAFGDKIKGFVSKQKEKQAGGQPNLIDKAKGLAGKLMNQQGQQAGPGYQPPAQVVVQQGPSAPAGMSTGLKIGLAVGGAAVLGLIIYLATRPKK